jgi:hypothetical protein
MKIKTTFLLLSLTILCKYGINAQDNKNIFIFGNSLIVHEPPAIPTPSDETTVPHWLHFLVEETSNSIAVSGQYGFLQQHDDLPPFSQWGFDSVTPAWDSDTEAFSEANFDTVLITAGNFIQDQPSNLAYYNDPNTTPVSATVSIIDWVNTQNSEMVTYIYENWPDMAGFIAGQSFPPSASEFENYNAYTQGDFNNWWLEYQDFLVAERPNETIKMIPVGPIISKLLSEVPFNQIAITDLYEDNAPHGRPTIYFLAAMITYSAIYQNPVPSNFVPPATINTTVASNYSYIADFIWDELIDFNFSSGDSRVFTDTALGITTNELNNLVLSPNPSTDHIFFNLDVSDYNISCYNVLGHEVKIKMSNLDNSIDTSHLSSGIWFIRINDGVKSIVKQIIKL